MGKCKSSIFYELSCSDGFDEYRTPAVQKQQVKVSTESTKKLHLALKEKYNKSSFTANKVKV